jgi:hypothetical protein
MRTQGNRTGPRKERFFEERDSNGTNSPDKCGKSGFDSVAGLLYQPAMADFLTALNSAFIRFGHLAFNPLRIELSFPINSHRVRLFPHPAAPR